MKNLLAIAFVVSVASVALAQVGVFGEPEDVVVTDSPFNTQRTQRWEYKVEERAAKNPGIVEKRLNDMAKEGWELSQIDQHEGLYIFRRQIQREGLAGFAFEDVTDLKSIKDDAREF